MKEARDPGRIVMICLGGLWLLDGVLQLQPAMFTNAFVSGVLTPTIQGQPAALAALLAAGINLFAAHIFWFNFASALVQLLIGALLIRPFSRAAQRFGLWLSVAWALIVWIFGEGLGLLFTGNATFYTGAPGSALLYAVLALFLIFSCEKKLPLAAAFVFLLGVVLNLMPMFWQPTMLSMLAMAPSASAALGAVSAQGTVLGNLIAVDLLACFGILLIFMPNRAVAWCTLAFLILVWWIGQSFGGLQTFPWGTATDPNSAPVLALFLLPILLAPCTARELPSAATTRTG